MGDKLPGCLRTVESCSSVRNAQQGWGFWADAGCSVYWELELHFADGNRQIVAFLTNTNTNTRFLRKAEFRFLFTWPVFGPCCHLRTLSAALLFLGLLCDLTLISIFIFLKKLCQLFSVQHFFFFLGNMSLFYFILFFKTITIFTLEKFYDRWQCLVEMRMTTNYIYSYILYWNSLCTNKNIVQASKICFLTVRKL